MPTSSPHRTLGPSACMSQSLKKLHKDPHGISCSGPTKHISASIDSIIKPLVPHIPSYIKDSSHVIALLEETCIPKDALLVTIDVSSLYTNIPKNEGTSACLEALEASQTTDPMTHDPWQITHHHHDNGSVYISPPLGNLSSPDKGSPSSESSR